MPLAQPKLLEPIEPSNAPVDLDATGKHAISLPILDKIDPWLRSPPTPNELWQYVLEYRQLGWNVFPVRGKKPAVAWKPFQTNRPSLTILRRMIDRPGVTGLAVVPGWVSGHKESPVRSATKLCVRDFDTQDAFLQWAEQYPLLAASLPVVRTKRGFHVYCWSPYEVFEQFDDGELRAKSNCFVLVPPSLHPDGPVYRWLIPFPLRPSALPVLCPKAAGFYPASISLPRSEITSARPLPKAGTIVKCHTSHFRETGTERDGVGERFGGLEARSPELSRDETEAIWASLPGGPGQREAKLFDLARRLKGIPHLSDAPVDSLACVVRDWWWRALPFIRTQEWQETWGAFSRAWKRVAFPIGTGPIHEMIRTAAFGSEPLEADRYGNPVVRRLVSVCAALQSAARSVGTDHFFLSCRTASAACDFHGPNGYRTAARWLKRLVADGVLELVKAGIGGTSSRLASEYRFLGSKTGR